MKHTTEYLFDKPRSEYEPELTRLATKRVKDAKSLLKTLAAAKNNRYVRPDIMEEIIERYQAVEKALDWWRKILEEE